MDTAGGKKKEEGKKEGRKKGRKEEKDRGGERDYKHVTSNQDLGFRGK